MSRIVFLHTMLFLLILLLSACSTTTPKTSERFFFPRPPNEPKIEYIGYYFSDYDLKPEDPGLMTKYVLGENLPERLFSGPVDVASDGKGRVFVTDSSARQVVMLELENSTHKTISSIDLNDGAKSPFVMPVAASIDSDGRLYVCDAEAKSVEVFDAQQRFLFSIRDPNIGRPTAVAVDTRYQRIYVLDTAQHRIAIFDMRGVLLHYLGERGIEPGQFNFPTDVDVDDQGHLYVLDSLNARVQVFDEAGAFLKMFGERGTAAGSFTIPKNLAVSDSGQVFVTDALAHKVLIFSPEGEFLLRIGGKLVVKKNVFPGGFYLPRGVDVDAAGGLWVVDSLNRIVHHFQILTPQYLSEHPLD